MWYLVTILWLASLVAEWQFIKHNPRIVGAVNDAEAKALKAGSKLSTTIKS